jgi:HAD superfamily hydrolase (TIGR01509 family)
MDQSGSFRPRGSRTRTEIKIRAVGFDFDHTLGIDNKLERVAFLRLLDSACVSEAHMIGTLAEEIERIDDLLARQRSGACTIEGAVESFMRERGCSDAHHYVDEYKRMCVDMVQYFVIPEPGVGEMLAELRRRQIPYAILTNGWSPLQSAKAARVGFDGPVLVSADLGIQKPEPAAYEALSKALGVPPEEIAFVGDTPAGDVAGALRAGMFAVWLDAEGVRYPQDVPPASAAIHRLPELLNYL